MSFLDRLLGRPLSTHEEAAHHIGLATGIPVLGLDAVVGRVPVRRATAPWRRGRADSPWHHALQSCEDR